MEHKDKLETAEALLNGLYDRIFDDDARVLSMLNLPGGSADAIIDGLGNSVRYIGLSVLREKLKLGSLDDGVNNLIDQLESRSKKHMRGLASKYMTGNEMSMSDLLRPGRKI